MKKKLITIIIYLTLVFSMINAQERQGKRQGMNPAMMTANITVTGKIYNENNNKPVEYANVILTSKRDNRNVNGNVSDENGIFYIKKVRPGRYFLDIQFMGFAKKRIEDIRIRPGSETYDIGEIYLESNVLNMEQVEVEADRVSVSFQIDKKVISVGRQAVAASGTAVDVLENVPSVEVDIEGNVSLRGSENFTVLIDGRPTILEPNEILQQLPASKIENIEIITNPSAKFNPDGVAGILNVIMKQNKLEGISGIVNINAGSGNKYGADALASYRNTKFSTFISMDYNSRQFTGNRISNRIMTDMLGNTFSVNSMGDIEHSSQPYSIRTGVDLFLTEKDFFSIGASFGNRSRNRMLDMEYEEISSLKNYTTNYKSIDESDRGGDYFKINMDYQHKFNNDGHEILGQTSFSYRTGNEESKNILKDLSGMIQDGQKSIESGPSNNMTIKFDYTLPLSKTDKFEAGAQSRIDVSEEANEVYYYNSETIIYDFQDQYSHETDYKNNIHSMYSMYSLERGRLGLQGGLRGEYTNRLVELSDENEKYSIDRIDFFPSAHLSWQQTENTQMMGSYTRRIQRPRGYWLEPFITWHDAYTVRQGNPAIEPEYIDSYEMSFLQRFGKNMFSIEAYRRINNNKVERVRSVFEDAEGVIMHTIANVGKDYVSGTEFMLRLNLFSWWNLNWMGNLYDYRIEGEYEDYKFNNSSFNWNMRLNSDFKLKTGTTLQINSRYNSSSVTSQGTKEGNYSVNLAVRQTFMKNKLSATLQVRDIFGSSKREYTTETPYLYSYNLMERESPMIMLNLRFNFNNYKDSKKTSRSDEGFDSGEDDF